MKVIYGSRKRNIKYLQMWRIVLYICFLFTFLDIIITTKNEAAASNDTLWQGDTAENTGNAQTQFLQHFISNSLDSESPRQYSPRGNQGNQQASPEMRSSPSTSGHGSYGIDQSDDIFAAAIKMVIALGAIVLLLAIGSYFLRRYILLSQPVTKQEPLLRLVSKLPITTKSMVALIEFSGKHILIGIASNTITALGEVQTKTLEQPETQAEQREMRSDPTDLYNQAAEATTKSFAASLEQYIKLHGSKEHTKDSVRNVQEIIQQKVSGLKRL